ncbi:MAG: hypothetical protein A2381_10485 [Bdellovibrionales bacterium RIFOXYB1_FULL_37_110]|nr:MAG: hypothetical protein A2417_05635 [Bdellovibrionales bacterium RIFOXYC1_FULL_37_79]OFZ56519.1 MAG: hypothetical protein A2328_06820 [Bdellovibrionales bacterium RIFOXYB2_FULL_36_6]OFZ61190.1 MAG: hypothetical protein A2381_10485 [Bdellovibrionales bacterium RIFOXYB1_FULL_37_110]OFZ65518.1 MAG: hypothetical protein A2577_01905 [Bdellovibrionales bacterium RIFOXYD1_FULL_36_51]
MKNFILLSEHSDIQSSKRLLETAMSLGLDTKVINPYECLLDLTSSTSKNLSDTLVLHRVTGIKHENYDLNFSGMLQANGAKIVNNLNAFEKLRDKEQQAVFFRQHQIAVIPAFGLRKRLGPTELDKIIEKLSPYHVDPKTPPAYIIKTTRGNQGVGTNLIIGVKSLKSILETLWAIRDQKFLIQPFLKEAYEYRILATSKGILGAIQRTPDQNDFRANAHHGTACKLKNLPAGLIEFAQNAFFKSGANYAALDLFLWQDQFMVVEINLVPGFRQMEAITGNNVAMEIIQTGLDEGKK